MHALFCLYCVILWTNCFIGLAYEITINNHITQEMYECVCVYERESDCYQWERMARQEMAQARGLFISRQIPTRKTPTLCSVSVENGRSVALHKSIKLELSLEKFFFLECVLAHKHYYYCPKVHYSQQVAMRKTNIYNSIDREVETTKKPSHLYNTVLNINKTTPI